MADRQFGLELVITDKGVAVIDQATKATEEFSEAQGEAAKASAELSAIAKSAAGALEFWEKEALGAVTAANQLQDAADKLGSRSLNVVNAEMRAAQEEAHKMNAAFDQSRGVILSASTASKDASKTVGALASSIGLTDAQLRGTFKTGLVVATGALRDHVRANADASEGMKAFADVTGTAAQTVQAMALGPMAALTVAAGFTGAKLWELHKATMALREENKLMLASTALLNDTEDKRMANLRELGAATGKTAEELLKLSTTDRAAYLALVKHAADGPEAKIADNMKAATEASIGMVRAQAAAHEISQRIAAEQAGHSGSSSSGGLNTVVPLADIMKHAKAKKDAIDGETVGVNALRKALADKRTEERAASAESERTKAATDALTNSYAAQTAAIAAMQAQYQVGGRGTVKFDDAKLGKALQGAEAGRRRGGASGSAYDAAIKAARSGDLGAVEDMARGAQDQASTLTRLGYGNNQSDQLAAGLANLAGELRRAIIEGGDRNATVTAEAIRSGMGRMKVEIDGAPLAAIVTEHQNRGMTRQRRV